ncbi:MAG: RHS repeat-associated core domain-containing protein, partial [Proteobacteria bacterium]|nr:RHS repeat-associated core domain-containing protein [Pseudomonadota bacterium]
DPNRPKTRLGYTGHEHFNKLGLVNMKGRIYDAHMGRFLQPDPFVPEPGNSQSWNRYAYVVNNPLNWTDPSGFSHHQTPCDGPGCPVEAVGENYVCTPFYICVPGDWDTLKKDAGAAWRGTKKGAGKVWGGIKSGARWVGGLFSGGGESAPPPEPTPTGEGDPPGPDTFQPETPHAREVFEAHRKATAPPSINRVQPG